MTDIDAITLLLKAYSTAVKNNDLDAVLKIYTKDAVFVGQDLPTCIGTDQIKGAYTQMFEGSETSFEFDVHEILVSGDMAFARTNSTGKITSKKDGSVQPEGNREFFLFQKVLGNWHIARYEFNYNVS